MRFGIFGFDHTRPDPSRHQDAYNICKQPSVLAKAVSLVRWLQRQAVWPEANDCRSPPASDLFVGQFNQPFRLVWCIQGMRTPLYDKPIIGFFNNVAAHLCSLLLRGLGDEPFNLGFGDRTALRTFTLLILPSD